jgi:single-strand DNA-binding protein
VYELEADEVGMSLRSATAKVAKVARTDGGEAQGSRQASGQGADPWAAEAPGEYSDEPPF